MAIVCALGMLNSARASAQQHAQRSVCPLSGTVKEKQQDTITVKSGYAAIVVRVTSDTRVLSAAARGPSPGDEVMIECRQSAPDVVIATTITVNLVRYSGTITWVKAGEIGIRGGGGAGEAPGRLSISFGRQVHFLQGSRADLQKGRDVEVTGFNLGIKKVQATALNVWSKR